MFLFVLPLSVLVGKYAYSALSHVWNLLNKRVFNLNNLIALLILSLLTLNLIATVNTDTNEIIGCYDRDVYKRIAYFVDQNVRQNDIVILSGDYHRGTFIEFYLKSDQNLSHINMVSFRNSSYIEKLLESPLSISIFAILNKEEDSKWNPNLYNLISTDFQLLNTFTDKYSEENTFYVYQLLER